MRETNQHKIRQLLSFPSGLCARDVLRLPRQVGQEDGAQCAPPRQTPGVCHRSGYFK